MQRESPYDAGSPWFASLPEGDENGASPGDKAPPASHFPLPGWPALPTVEYFTKIIVLGLLLLALPYLIGAVLTRPEKLLAGGRAPVPMP